VSLIIGAAVVLPPTAALGENKFFNWEMANVTNGKSISWIKINKGFPRPIMLSIATVVELNACSEWVMMDRINTSGM
jgi:hypothetical protein